MGNDYRLYELNYVKFWKRQEFGDSQRIRGCWGLEGGRGEQVVHRGCLGSESAPDNAIMGGTCDTFVQTHRLQGSEP